MSNELQVGIALSIVVSNSQSISLVLPSIVSTTCSRYLIIHVLYLTSVECEAHVCRVSYIHMIILATDFIHYFLSFFICKQE